VQDALELYSGEFCSLDEPPLLTNVFPDIRPTGKEMIGRACLLSALESKLRA